LAEQSIFQRRFSCREFHPGPLSEAQLAALLDAARWAPSAGNLQPWRFIVVTSEEIRRALSAAA
jgi:nitroreductase